MLVGWCAAYRRCNETLGTAGGLFGIPQRINEGEHYGNPVADIEDLSESKVSAQKRVADRGFAYMGDK